MNPTLHTSRSALLLLTDTSPNSPHVQYFHELWSDTTITAWSLHGATASLIESRGWMKKQLHGKYDTIFYSLFARAEEGKDRGLGEHVGFVSLRLQGSGASLPHTLSGKPGKIKKLRVLAYAMLEKAWGKGYATEACRAVLDAYAASVGAEKPGGEKVYVEATIIGENLASVRVLEKLGFEKVGWKEEEEKMWLNGAWRSGYWVYGLYI